MGLLSRLRVLGDPGIQGLMRSDERWAKILVVGPRMGPRVRLDLEIHEDGKVSQVRLWTTLPLGVKPEVGQDIAWRHGNKKNVIEYHLQWDQKPQYGAPETDVQALGAEVARQYTDRAVAAGEIVTQEQTTDPVSQLKMLAQMRDSGQISEEQFEQHKADLNDWVAHPEEAMDPHYQLERLERRHAAGEVSEADYLERKADIGRWIANTQPPSH